MGERKEVLASTGGAISLSALASFVSLCCIGPWSVALLGVTGAVTMARWAFVRPYVLVLAVILLGWGFWRIYGPSKVCEKDKCSRRSSILLQVVLWSASVMVILAFFAEELQWLLVDPTPEAQRR